MPEGRRSLSFHRVTRSRARQAAGGDSPEVPVDAGTSSGQKTPQLEHPRGESERIVIPRQDRGDVQKTNLGIELREARYGAASRGPYLRVVPRQRRFVKSEPGYLEATELASAPVGGVERWIANAKRLAIGNPFASSQAIHERLTKVKALAVFSSDVLSSSAYATEEILIVLVLAGSGALSNALPIAAAIVLLLAMVTISYRQTIKAYPNGGGAYIVAHDNLGTRPGLLAAAALLVDYVLTVSVSIAAGVAAVTSALPELHEFRVPIGIGIIALITLGNLRGVRESGTIFALPTYFFIVAIGSVLIVGLVKVVLGDAPGSLLHEAPPREQLVATEGLTLWIILRAFSQGCAALTGTEAISNGVPAFKPPESQNARTTLTAMAIILGLIFLGVTFLTSRFGLVPQEHETIISALGKEVVGQNILYYAFQAATALILFLAANTSFADFPRLSAILASDRFMPRQFAFRGDRLGFSNGILVLAAAASVLLAVFGGEVNRLIPLYALGVFVSFTLSQSGMVRRFLRLREAGWKSSVAISGAGALATGVVAVIIVGTKFTQGAWMSILMMLTLMVLFALIRRHYDWFYTQIEVDLESLPVGIPKAVALDPGGRSERVVVPVDGINKITLGALGMAREISNDVTAVHLTDDRELAEEFRERWRRAVPDVPLLLIESPYRAFVAPMLAYLESLPAGAGGQRTVLLLPTFAARHWWERLLHSRDVQRLKRFAKDLTGVRILEFPFRPQPGNAA